MTIHYVRQNGMLVILGKTYAYKEAIKAIGARFNGKQKVWEAPASDTVESLIDELCRSTGGGILATDSTVNLGAFSGEPAAVAPGIQDAQGGYSISQLLRKVQTIVAHGFPSSVWVVGEIQNFTAKASGCFFNLVEGKGGIQEVGTYSIKATLWMDVFRQLDLIHGEGRLSAVFQDGTQVRLFCQVSFYRERSQVSLIVNEVDLSFTKGALALAREALLRELRSQGLDQLNKRLAMPSFPLRVGLITADNSRAAGDFIHQLYAGGFPGEVLHVLTTMQGEATVREVTAAIDQLVRLGCDCIVLTRGGGSAADLQWFDARPVALAIAHSRIPVVAAIGHHDDFCVAEEVAKQREKTPTAAAEFILGCFEAVNRRLENAAVAIAARLERGIKVVSMQHQALELHLQHAARTLVTRYEQLLAHLGKDVDRSAQTQIASFTDRVHDWHRVLASADPKPWLESGWTQLVAAGRIVKSMDNVGIGENISARLRDGSLRMRIEAKEVRASALSETRRRSPDD